MYKTHSSIKGETYRWHTLFKVSSLVSWKLFHCCCTLCMYSISDNKADFEFGNVHFTSFWFQHKKCGEAWVNCVYSDSDSERQQLWSTFIKGEVIFFLSLSLCAEQRFTASPWLLQLGYITANMWKMRRRGKKRWKMDEGKKGLDDVIHFIATKKILSAGKTQKHCIFFSKMPKWWATATKTMMVKGGGKPNQWGVSSGNQKPEKQNKGISCPSG